MANLCDEEFINAAKEVIGKRQADFLNDFVKKGSGSIEDKVERLIKDQETKMNARRKEKLDTILKANAVFEQADRFKKKPWTGLRAEVDAIQSDKKLTRNGASRMQQVAHLKLFGLMDENLNNNKVMTDFINLSDQEEDVSAEMWSPQKDSTENVKQLSSALVDTLEGARKLMIKAGVPDLGHIKNYVMKQMSNPGRMRSPTGHYISDKKLQFQLMREFGNDGQKVSSELRRMSFERWKNTKLPELNLEKTFGKASKEEIDAMMKEDYDSMSSGEYQTLGKDGPFLEGGTPFNLAKKIAAHRNYIFNDGRGFSRYQKEYGYGSFKNQFMKQLWEMGNQMGVIEKFGAHPEASYNFAKEKLIAKNKHIPNIREKFNWSDNTFQEVMGRTTGIPTNLLGKIAVALQAVRSANLGNIWPMSLPDFAMYGAKAKSYGGSYLKADFDAAANLISGKERIQEVGKKLGIFSETLMGSTISRFSSADAPFSDFARLNAFIYKYNFMEHHDFALGNGWSASAAEELGGWANRKFEDLPVGPKRLLTIHGLEENEWDLIRDPSNKMTKVKGQFLLSTEMAKKLSPKSIAGYLNKSENSLTAGEISDVRSKMEDRWINYFLDESQDVIPTPSASTRAIANQGTRGDTFKGRLLRYVFQFKSWNIEAMMRTYGRQILGQGGEGIIDALSSGKADISGMVGFMLQQVKWGYISAAAVNFTNGLEPPDPTSAKTWVEAADRGGVGSLFLGVIDQAMGKYGESLSTISVPGLQPAADIASLIKATIKGNHPLFAMAKLAQHNIPPLNVYYFKSALEHLFLLGLMEYSKPGYMRSLENRAKKNGDKYFMPPSKHTNTL